MIKQFLYKTIMEIVDLFYPEICVCCQLEPPSHEEYTCLTCRLALPNTDFHLSDENEFTDRFKGRVNLQCGMAMYYYRRGGYTQKIIYKLKYKGLKEIGIELGRAYGYEIQNNIKIQDVDLILPVPLHPKKKRLRGYNQSEMIAMGLSEALKKPFSSQYIKRKINTTTQTNKGSYGRLSNVENKFEGNNILRLKNKHILLVDDVLTTGATLEACARVLVIVPNIKISMLTLAIAVR